MTIKVPVHPKCMNAIMQAQIWCEYLGVTLDEFVLQAVKYQVESLGDQREDEAFDFVRDILKTQRPEPNIGDCHEHLKKVTRRKR